MIIRRSEKKPVRMDKCHDGAGTLWCTEMLADYKKAGNGFKYIHDNMLEPGASIGEHAHKDDEELYVILWGRGVMKVDGVPQQVQAGDMCLTRAGHSHDLTNGPEGAMHFLVIAINTNCPAAK
jgi:mannose-6-phosphate isomerase-like protein (cupin superfamily)